MTGIMIFLEAKKVETFERQFLRYNKRSLGLYHVSMPENTYSAQRILQGTGDITRAGKGEGEPIFETDFPAGRNMETLREEPYGNERLDMELEWRLGKERGRVLIKPLDRTL